MKTFLRKSYLAWGISFLFCGMGYSSDVQIGFGLNKMHLASGSNHIHYPFLDRGRGYLPISNLGAYAEVTLNKKAIDWNFKLTFGSFNQTPYYKENSQPFVYAVNRAQSLGLSVNAIYTLIQMQKWSFAGGIGAGAMYTNNTYDFARFKNDYSENCIIRSYSSLNPFANINFNLSFQLTNKVSLIAGIDNWLLYNAQLNDLQKEYSYTNVQVARQNIYHQIQLGIKFKM